MQFLRRFWKWYNRDNHTYTAGGVRIHVRRNGSRYIDPGELMRSEMFRETIKRMMARDRVGS